MQAGIISNLKYLHGIWIGKIFCSDWCNEYGYTRTEARKIYHGGIGEFMKLPEGNGIIRFAI